MESLFSHRKSPYLSTSELRMSYLCSRSPGLRFSLRRAFSAPQGQWQLCAFVHVYSRGKTAPDFHRLPLRGNAAAADTHSIFIIISKLYQKVKVIDGRMGPYGSSTLRCPEAPAFTGKGAAQLKTAQHQSEDRVGQAQKCGQYQYSLKA